MTLRATIIGVLGALFIACAGTISGQIWWEWGSLTEGRLVPIIVFGMLPVLLVAVNPLLGAIRPKLRLRASEVAVIVALMLAGCSIPGGGAMRAFSQPLVMPAYHNASLAGWRKARLLEYAPPALLPAGGKYDQQVTESFVGGMGRQDDPIGLGDIPWSQWRAPLSIWLPLIALTGIAGVCLSLIVHRQWSSRERLRYPIAEFAATLIEQDDHRVGPIFRSKMFWLGFAIVGSIRLINGLNRWFPEETIEIPLSFNFWAIAEKFPVLAETPMGQDIVFVHLWPTAIAFSFFLASDIALSLGLTQYLFIAIMAALMAYGVNITSTYMAGGATAWQRFGSFVAFALILLYIGRRHYWQVLKSVLPLRRHVEVNRYEAWAARILIVSTVAMIAIISEIGLDWPLAIAMVGMILLMMLVTARIGAETGLFSIMPRWMPMGMLLALLGGYAMGPKAIVICGLLSVILCLDTGESLMPYLVNGLRLCDRCRVKPGRVGWAGGGVFVLGLALAVPAVLWVNYNFGTAKDNNWTFNRVPKMTFDIVETSVSDLTQAGTLVESEQLGALDRIAKMKPKPMFLWSAGIGAALVLLIGMARLRHSWWPLHPVLFLVWATWPLVRLHHSFMIGWMLKMLVTRFGGHLTYQSVKKMMVGVVAADLLSGLIFLVISVAYHFLTGRTPIIYEMFP